MDFGAITDIDADGIRLYDCEMTLEEWDNHMKQWLQNTLPVQNTSTVIESGKYYDCVISGCDRSALYSTPGNRMPLLCRLHRTSDMVVVKLCSYYMCIRPPVYNFANYLSPKYCASHYDNGMVKTDEMKCCILGCKKIPFYGRIGGIRTLCNEHWISGMVDVSIRD